MSTASRSFSLVVVAATLASGCASPPPDFRTLANRPTCASNRDCRIPVFVGADPVSDACVVIVSFDEARVAKGKQPKVVWNLDALDPGDGYRYQFHPMRGIEFKTQTPITPADYIDGRPMGQDKYSWKAVNGNRADFEYGVNVQRKTSHADWEDCPTLDPKMINDGP